MPSRQRPEEATRDAFARALRRAGRARPTPAHATAVVSGTKLDGRRQARGQSLVEFALVLPILFLLLLISIDFGRVYLGYINVQNMARIAANQAATDPDAWINGDGNVIASYRRQILEDARAINCALPLSGGTLDASVNPVFSGTNVGDTATVRISCSFGVITPGISNIVGGTVQGGGEATFPIRTGMIANGGGTGGGIEKPAVDFYAEKTSVTEGTAVQFRYSGGGGTPTHWLWEFVATDGTVAGTSTDQDPLFTFDDAGAYDVTVTATNSAGSDAITKTSYIIVLPSSSVAFTASPVSGAVPLAVTFTDQSAGAVTWSWDFGDGGSSTQKNPTHSYTGVGTFDVTLTIEDGSGTKSTLTRTAYISTSSGLCTVPDFFNVSTSNAQSLWGSKGFTTQVQYQGGNLPWPIKSQTIVGGSQVPCNSTITVKKN